MGLHIPGLSEALEKLDDTGEKMAQMNANIQRIVESLDNLTHIMQEQNEILSDLHNLSAE